LLKTPGAYFSKKLPPHGVDRVIPYAFVDCLCIDNFIQFNNLLIILANYPSTLTNRIFTFTNRLPEPNSLSINVVKPIPGDMSRGHVRHSEARSPITMILHTEPLVHHEEAHDDSDDCISIDCVSIEDFAPSLPTLTNRLPESDAHSNFEPISVGTVSDDEISHDVLSALSPVVLAIRISRRLMKI
jgi:hypothetical protein